MIALLPLLLGLASPPPASPAGGEAAAGSAALLAGGSPADSPVAAPAIPPAAAAGAPLAGASGRAAPHATGLGGRPPQREDRWFAEDKLKHFFMSFAATSLAYGSVRAVGLDGAPGLAVAGGAVVALGVGKEWRDRRAGGPFSIRDLVWDAAGIGAALFIAAGTR